MPDIVSLVLIGLAAAVGGVWLFSCIFIVRGKQAAVLETFGKPHTAARMPGLHLKMPWPITSVVGRVNLQIQEITEDVSIKTKDNSFMLLPAKVQFCASNSPEGAVKAFYELENPQAQISSYILNSIRMTASGMDMEELYSARSEMENDVQERLTEQFAGFGYVIKNVLVDEPQPSSEVRSAFNRVIASKREKEAAQNVADAERIRLVGIASAEAESKKLQGEGIAQMRDALAKGLKESIELITSANVSTEQALALLMDTNRQDTLSSVAAKGNLVVMDLSKGSEQIGQYMAASKAVVGSDSSLAHQKT